MQAREHIRSISYLTSHAAQISEAVTTKGAPFIITQNGEAAMVIEGVQQYQEKEDLIALRKLLALGEEDRQAGLGLSVEASRGHRMAITGPTLLDLTHAHPSPSPHCGQPGRLASAAVGPFAAGYPRAAGVGIRACSRFFGRSACCRWWREHPRSGWAAPLARRRAGRATRCLVKGCC
jgi:PHD/YefM family antitoxin component YafN of YafNO toxin-antitoxin module